MRYLHTSHWRMSHQLHAGHAPDVARRVFGSLPVLVKMHGLGFESSSGVQVSACPSEDVVANLRDMCTNVYNTGAQLVASRGNYDKEIKLGLTGHVPVYFDLNMAADAESLSIGIGCTTLSSDIWNDGSV